jgi:hypothetical protein
VRQFPASQQTQASVVLPICFMIRDHIGWAELSAYIDQLPTYLKDMPQLREQVALAQSKSGEHIDAIAGLKVLLSLQGESSERYGLIGGRFKKIALAAQKNHDSKAALAAIEQSIEAYERGMRLELGDYYCVSNLARLYRIRGEEGDENKAQFAQQLTTLMAQSAIDLNKANEWARPTLLGSAFDSQDSIAAAVALKGIIKEGPAKWKLETTISDLEISVRQITDLSLRIKFENILGQMKGLL